MVRILILLVHQIFHIISSNNRNSNIHRNSMLSQNKESDSVCDVTGKTNYSSSVLSQLRRRHEPLDSVEGFCVGNSIIGNSGPHLVSAYSRPISVQHGSCRYGPVNEEDSARYYRTHQFMQSNSADELCVFKFCELMWISHRCVLPLP